PTEPQSVPTRRSSDLQNTSGYRQDLRRVEYGDERDSTTRAWMERSAPLTNADRVTKPLFVVQGMNDPRVPRSEAEQMVAALERRDRKSTRLNSSHVAI